jgi:hypothetical protein
MIDWHLVVELIALAGVMVGNSIVVHVTVAGARADIRTLGNRLERLEKKDDKATERALDQIDKKRRKGEGTTT